MMMSAGMKTPRGGHGGSGSAMTMSNKKALGALSQDHVDTAFMLCEKLENLQIHLNEITELELDHSFNAHLSLVLSNLGERMRVQADDHLLRDAEIVYARQELYDLVSQIVELVSAKISPQLGEAVATIRTLQKQWIIDLRSITRTAATNAKNDARALQEEEAKNSFLRCEMQKMQEKVRESEEALKEQRREVKRLQSLLDARDEHVEAGAEGEDFFSMSKPSPSKGIVPSGGNGDSPREVEFLSSDIIMGDGTRKTPLKSFDDRYRNDKWLFWFRAAVQEVLKLPYAPNGCLNVPKKAKNAISGKVRATGSGLERGMSLAKCKSIINQLYESKFAEKSTMQDETMELHVYTEFTRQYGVLSIAVMHASTFIRCVLDKHINDNDLHVFWKIFNHEIDESFALAQEALKATVRKVYEDQVELSKQRHRKFMSDSFDRGKTHSSPGGSTYTQTVHAQAGTNCSSGERERERERERGAARSWPQSRGDGSRFSVTLGRSPSSCSATSGHSHLQESANSAKRRSIDTISSTQRQKQSRDISSEMVTEYAWLPILHYIYKDADVTALNFLLKRLARDFVLKQREERAGRIPGRLLKKMDETLNAPIESPLSLPYAVFLECVLDFQLRMRMLFLAPLLHEFLQCDQNSDGVISEAQFRRLMMKMMLQQRHGDDMYTQAIPLLKDMGDGEIDHSLVSAGMSMSGMSLHLPQLEDTIGGGSVGSEAAAYALTEAQAQYDDLMYRAGRVGESETKPVAFSAAALMYTDMVNNAPADCSH